MLAHGPDGLLGRVVDATLRIALAGTLLLIGLMAYQEWGTALEHNRAQRRLAGGFERAVRADADPPSRFDVVDAAAPAPSRRGAPHPASPQPLPSPPSDAAPPSGQARPDLLQFAPGDPVARLEIEAIDLDEIVVAGALAPQLRVGPGLVERSALPGELGHSLIGGHRTTYGGPFERLDELAAGDELVVTGVDGRPRRYRVLTSLVVDPSLQVVVEGDAPGRALLTLFTCHPKWSTRERLAVTAELAEPAAPATPSRPQGGQPEMAVESSGRRVLELAVSPAPPANTAAPDVPMLAATIDLGAAEAPGWWSLAAWTVVLLGAVVGAHWAATGRPLALIPAGIVVLAVAWPFCRALNQVAVNGGWLLERLAA